MVDLVKIIYNSACVGGGEREKECVSCGVCVFLLHELQWWFVRCSERF